MIYLENCLKYFHKNSVNEVCGLNHLSLEIKDGDFITVIGSNGAGKSTMLNCLAGCFFLDEGRVVIGRHDVTRWPEYKRAKFIARVFQDPLLGTCPTASIEQNLALALLRGKKRGFGRGIKPANRDFFKQKLSVLNLGLERRLKDRAGLLSGGQRQALTMLMATMLKPEILLLDEHIAALDPKTAHQILTLTREIVSAENLTTMMITHNMKHAIEFGNRLIMLHQGRVIFDIADAEKSKLSVKDLVNLFYEARGEEMAVDSVLLA